MIKDLKDPNVNVQFNTNKQTARLALLVRSLTANQEVPARVQSPAWSRVELWATFFRHTVRGQRR